MPLPNSLQVWCVSAYGVLWYTMKHDAAGHACLEAIDKESQVLWLWPIQAYWVVQQVCAKQTTHNAKNWPSMTVFPEQFDTAPLKKARQLSSEKHTPAPVIVKDWQQSGWRKHCFIMCAAVPTFIAHSPKKLTQTASALLGVSQWTMQDTQRKT
jgi:hypothetical protein